MLCYQGDQTLAVMNSLFAHTLRGSIKRWNEPACFSLCQDAQCPSYLQPHIFSYIPSETLINNNYTASVFRGEQKSLGLAAYVGLWSDFMMERFLTFSSKWHRRTQVPGKNSAVTWVLRCKWNQKSRQWKQCYALCSANTIIVPAFSP